MDGVRLVQDILLEVEVSVSVVIGDVLHHLVDEAHLALRKLSVLYVFAEEIAEDSAEILVARIGQEAVFNAIVDERALEFVGEMLRKNDLIRWNLLKTKMDESQAELKKYLERTDKYAQFGPAVWFRNTAGGNIEFYGYDEVASTDAAPAGDGWECNLNYFKFTSENKDTGEAEMSESATKKLNSFYDINPDTRQWWPIPEATLTNSQGTLVNDYGF